jgi:methyl coenzyme M reductase subunit C
MRLGFMALAALVLFQAGGGPAFAQQNTVEESGALDRRPAADDVNDKSFDCHAFRELIGAAQGGFSAQRGTVTRASEDIAIYAAATPLFGTCQIIDKKKVDETSFSCEVETVTLADIKATVDSCLGADAGAYAANENPNTPFLRYDVKGAARARVIVLKTFGKITLAIFKPK